MLSLNIFSLFICVILLSITVVVQSRYEFHPEIQRYSKQHKQVATYEEAKRRCQSEGAILASPVDAQLIKYMKSIITVNNHTTPYFIGIKAKLDEEAPFVTEEGILLEDIPEVLDLVEELDSRNGDCLCMDGHTIRVVPCWTRLPYICFKNVTQEDATNTEIPTTSPTDCNTGYKLDSRTGSYYKFHNNNAAESWDVANSTCVAEGGFLAILNNSYEARIITYITFPLGSSDYAFVWIGLRDTTGNSDWHSVHGEPIEKLYNVFHQSPSKFDCVVLRFDGKLVSWPCSDELPFICEKRVLDTC